MSNYKLKTIGVGSKFTYGGISWVLLQKTKTAALCLAEKILFYKAFDKDNKNNWAESLLRKHLNGEFLDSLVAAGADKAVFTPFMVDLTADDGLKDYSKVRDKISLITCDLYRKHRYTIPNADDWWWTVTPLSTASNANSYYVRVVRPSGTLGLDNAYCGYYGVRPLCNLNSSILVDVTELTGFTPEEEPKAKAESAKNIEETQKKESTRQMHATAIKLAYEALHKMEADFMEDGGSDTDIEKITNAVVALQSITQIELTDEEKAELQATHKETLKYAYKCVQLSFDLYIEKTEWNYPDKATQALATLKALIG